MEGAADAVRTRARVSNRYFAKVAAWSELPRAHVTTARGGRARSLAPRSFAASRFRLSCSRTAAPAWAASRNMRVHAGSTIGLFIRRAQLGDEVVGVAAKEGLAELHRAPVAQES